MAVEEQFYLVWPLLVLLVGRVASRRGRGVRRPLGATIVALSLGSAALYLLWFGPAFQASYFASPARAWQLGAGAFVALIMPALRHVDERTGGRRLVPVLAWSGALAIAVVPLADRVGLYAAAAAAVAGASALIAAGGLDRGRTSAPARFLALRPVRFVGRRSFTWYLWHVPVVVAAEHLGARTWPALLAAELLAALPALLTMHFIERPLRSARRLRSPRAGLLFGAAGLIVVAVPALVLSF